MKPDQFFKCLGDETRLRCLALLHDHGELCVCDLVEALALSQPKISRHLAQLRACGLVEDERRGKWVYYRLPAEMPGWMRTVYAGARAAFEHDPAFQAAVGRARGCAQTAAGRCG